MMPTKFKEINWCPSVVEMKDFGRKLLLGFPFVALFWTCLLALGEGSEWGWEVFTWIAGVGCGLGILCIQFPTLSIPIYRLWFFLVCLIDTLITAIALPTFFYIILSPYGFLVRIAGKSSIQKKPINKDSYWVEISPPKSLNQYYRQF
tara:strand:+ start:22 stop:465 length:444 start_codon:yes stop_codon:yes gene_type:complete